MSQTTERLNLWSANDFVLARCGFVRFIALRCMFIWCFVSTCKSPSSNSVYKIPCKNYLREIFDDCSLPSHWGFSIKNPTIESEVSWSSLLSFLHFRRTEFTTDGAVNPDRVPASSPEKLQAQTKICIFWNPAKLQAEQGFPDWFFSLWWVLSLIQKNLRPVYPLCRQRRVNIHL